MIPIKGYATFDPLKHCWIGSGFKAEWFDDLFPKNKKISDPLKRIADETEEDYLKLIDILHSCGVKTYRSFLNLDKYKSLHEVGSPPTSPRDQFAVIGEKFYVGNMVNPGFTDVIDQIDTKDIRFINRTFCTASICRVGKDIFWDEHHEPDVGASGKDWDKFYEDEKQVFNKITNEGFRVHKSLRRYHSDGAFCVVKPGCIVSLYDVQDYKKEFPGWEVLYLPDQSWERVHPFLKMKDKVGGRWWLKGEEDNNQLIEFVNTWLNDWVGYVEETVFDVNMLSINQELIICNNYNKEVFEHFKKHKVEPIVFNFRHRYFWDGGIHCITQDLYREGKMEDYFG